MKENDVRFEFLFGGLNKKFFSIFALLLFVYCSGTVRAEKVESRILEHKVTLKMEMVYLDSLFKEMGRQVSCEFLFNRELVRTKGKVSMYAQNRELKDLLAEQLPEVGLEYLLDGDVVIIREQNKVRTPATQIETAIIKGKIIDAKGNPIPGATVHVKGTTFGTVARDNGHFELELPAKELTLLISFVGMKQVSVKYVGQKELNITMYEDVQDIDEVVVTGYQVLDKRVLTSSISTVKAEDLDKMGALTIDQMLEGKAPGLMIMNVSAQPGAAAKVRVRAGATFTGTREPLWVIDGVIYEDPVPLSAAEINSLDNVNLIGNAITGLNPQDIAQIDILKDASATAIYGTRAANGVIVITTKRGKEGSLSLTYNGSVSLVDRPRYSDLNLMNSKERIDVSREIAQKNLYYPRTIHQYVGYEGALRKYHLRELDYAGFQQEVARLETLNEDWFGELYRMAVTQAHGVNLSGGNKKIRVYAGLNYDNQRGTEINVGLYRVSGRINTDFNLRENVLISIGISGSSQKGKYNHSAYSAFNEAYNMSRAIPARDENGELLYIDRVFQQLGKQRDYYYAKYNILNELENSRKTIWNKDINLRASVDWEIIKGLKIRSQFSYRNTSNMIEEWIGGNTYFMAKYRSYEKIEDRDDGLMELGSLVPFGGIYSGGSTSSEALLITTQINYNKSIAEHHHFNLNIGHEASSTTYQGAENWMVPGYNHEQGRSFIKAPLPTNFKEFKYPFMLEWIGDGDYGFDIYPSVTDKVTNVMSAFGIFNYSYDNLYVLNFNIRSDGSNRFGQYQRYKFRPAWSVSARWNIHEELFMTELKNRFLDELALRFSYGFRGNPPSATPYLTITKYGQTNVDLDPEYVSYLASFPNANLKWERTKTINVGLNHSWFGGRISGAIDYGYSKSTDLLLSRPVSLVNGTPSSLYNGGSKDDHTFEFNVMTQNIKTKNFQWNMNFNITRVKEKILRGIDSGLDWNSVNSFLDGSIYMEGFPLDGFYSYRFGGLDENGLPTFEGFVPNQNLANRDEYWDTRTIYAQLQKALVYEGSRLPKFYGGFGTEFRYKNLTLSASFTYKIGQKTRLLEMYNGMQTMPMPEYNMPGEFNNRWRKPGDENHTNVPALSNSALIPHNDVSPYILPFGNSYWWAYDRSNIRTAGGSYIRWQLLSMYYTLPNKHVERLGASNVRFGFQIQNLGVFAFDKKLKGKDPEQVRQVGMPVLPSYNFSLSFSF